ncbi:MULTISPECIES: VOC family protein [unclassified Shinella]|jgi:catechol 2,3-dioxygenase-like lactoylglutathione lyase family enzyme|uniref:VOC family protein n=1 Tax=unclassified Shinella TaxID=2643062 RepID=UPI0003C566A4|nr:MULTISPECIES: VOC family protein [unclassified Shinella]MCA0343825.1 VOC family protein [Pseudomonadota bacterium]EYR84478.1 glyoxalase protein [Shinella sp. DD12]MCO5148891.1 VOC family protein [Shinella sp.]MDC7264950.1 VOC family protein [Shinella sp. HY16]MDC7271847.1 VOC family protein [Shinella sp. YZ44]
MPQMLAHIALLVRDYDEAIAFFVGKLGFDLIEDTYQPDQDKRWVVVGPRGQQGCSVLLARASSEHQADYIGDQAGGRVFLFLRTDAFWKDYQALVDRGVEFVREPKEADYGVVAVFKDLYGNLWDLVEFTDGRP